MTTSTHNCTQDLICLNQNCHSMKEVGCKDCLPRLHIEHIGLIQTVDSVKKSKIKKRQVTQEISDLFQDQSNKEKEFLNRFQQSLMKLQYTAKQVPKDVTKLKKSDLQFCEAFVEMKNEFTLLCIQAKNFSDWLPTFGNKYLNQIDPSLGQSSEFSMVMNAIEDGENAFFSNNASPRLSKESSEAAGILRDETLTPYQEPNDQQILNKKDSPFSITPSRRDLPNDQQKNDVQILNNKDSPFSVTPSRAKAPQDQQPQSPAAETDQFTENPTPNENLLNQQHKEIKELNKIPSQSLEEQQVEKLDIRQSKQSIEEKTKKPKIVYSDEIKNMIIEEVLADPQYASKQQISRKIYEKYGVCYETVKRWLVERATKNEELQKMTKTLVQLVIQ